MSEISRRQLNRGLVWSVPVVAMAATAPAFAASQRNDPGINGWVQISTTERETRGQDTYRLRINSNVPGPGPDGAPYGLYTRNPTVSSTTPRSIIDTIDMAALTIWLRTDQDNTPSNGWSNPGVGWGNATLGTTSSALGLGDTQSYRAYRFDYNGPFTLVNDGTIANPSYRAVLNNFDAATYVNGADATYWVERTIRINGEVLSFRRRNGDDGALGDGFPGGGLNMRVAPKTDLVDSVKAA